MKNLDNHIKNLLELKYNISVDVNNKNVFAEAENNEYYVILETSDIYGDALPEVYINNEPVTDSRIVNPVAQLIFNAAKFEVENDSEGFTYQDQQHANNLIYS